METNSISLIFLNKGAPGISIYITFKVVQDADYMSSQTYRTYRAISMPTFPVAIPNLEIRISSAG